MGLRLRPEGHSRPPLLWQLEHFKIGMHGRHTNIFHSDLVSGVCFKSFGLFGEMKGGKSPSHSVVEAGPGVGEAISGKMFCGGGQINLVILFSRFCLFSF